MEKLKKISELAFFCAISVLTACQNVSEKDYYENKNFFESTVLKNKSNNMFSYVYMKKDTSVLTYLHFDENGDTIFSFRYCKNIFPDNIGVGRWNNHNRIYSFELMKFRIVKLQPLTIGVLHPSNFTVILDSNYHIEWLKKYADSNHVKYID